MWIDIDLQLFSLNLLVLVIAEIISRFLGLTHWGSDLCYLQLLAES